MTEELENTLENLNVGDVCYTVYNDGSDLQAISLVTKTDEISFTDIKALNFNQEHFETWTPDDSLKELRVLFNVTQPETLAELALKQLEAQHPEYSL